MSIYATTIFFVFIGPSIDGCRTKIFNPDSDGEGEIIMSSTNIMMGYLFNDEKTAEAIDMTVGFILGIWEPNSTTVILKSPEDSKNSLLLLVAKMLHQSQ